MRKALKVTPEGVVSVLDLDSPIASSLTIMQGAVEGLIQPVDINEELTMYVNEEFHYSGQDLNPLGSAVLQREHDNREAFVLGNVLFTGGVDDEGNTKGLTEAQEQMLTFLAYVSTP